jgi:single-stranded DNA-binding protein
MLFEAKKGEKVQVSGQIDIDEYEKDGVKRTSVCLIVDHCRVLPKSQMATGTQQPVATSKSEELPF